MQLDYRDHPNAGGRDRGAETVGTYDRPIDQGSMETAPWTDQSWKSYDAAEDASRFNGINTPEQQARLLAGTTPDGFSPDAGGRRSAGGRMR
jgi:hypothetical protein